MSTDRWFPHLTVAAIIQRDNKFLCVEEHPRHANVINQPAGHVDENESILEAVKREVLEETGYAFEPSDIVGLYYFTASNQQTYLRVCYTGSITAQIHDGPLDPDIMQTHWFELEELKRQTLRSPIVIDAISDYLDGQRFPLSLITHKRVKTDEKT